MRTAGKGNRAFWWMVGISALARALLAYGACCLALAVVIAVRSGGLITLWSNHPSLVSALLVLAVLAVGVGRAGWLLGTSAWHSIAFAQHVRRHAASTPGRLIAKARWGGIDGRLVVLATAAPFALTYGVLSPRVLVTTGLVETLSDAELGAVLAHEREHLRNRDPLKILLARAILARHFYLPALAGLRDRFASARELSADRAALKTHGITSLAGALFKVTEAPAWAAASPSAAMSTDALLEARISQLETGTEPPPPRTGRRAMLYTLTGGLVFGSAVGWSAIIVAHYLPQCIPGLR